MKNWIDFYLKTSIHIGFAVLALLQITKLELQTNCQIAINYFVFLGTILAYNFLKYYSAYSFKTLTIKRNFDVILVSFIAFLGTVFTYFYLFVPVQLAVLQIVIVVLLYPFLRKFGFIKMFVVSFCVTFTTVYLPAIYLKETPENLYILLIQRFLIVICLLIPFEILDSKTDEKQLKTLPQLFGIPATKFFGIILLILFLVLSFIGFRKEKMVIDVIISVATGLFIAFSNINRNRYYTAFWVESMPVFWLLIYLLIYQF